MEATQIVIAGFPLFQRDDTDPATYRKMPYPEYLLSTHWDNLRQLALRHYGEWCQHPNCKYEGKYLHVHHLTYCRLGEEQMHDLTVLCGNCHEKHHQGNLELPDFWYEAINPLTQSEGQIPVKKWNL